MFSLLSDEERAELLKAARVVACAAGEAVVRQGAEGGSLFIIRRGDLSVKLAGAEGRVAHLHAGDVFGEMSLLTGEPRNATVVAETDSELLELDAVSFRRLVLANPTVLDRVTQATTARREEIDHRGEEDSLPVITADTLLSRVKSFLRL
jgi:CRP-like cAMP-binding protein